MHPSILVPLTVGLTMTAAAQSGNISQTEALTRLLSAEQPQATWFAPEFLERVPFETVARQMESIRQTYGAFQRLDTQGGRPVAVFERGSLVITAVSLDAQGRLTSFGAAPPSPLAAAQTPADRDAIAQTLTRVFQPETADPALFAPEFLEAVPIRSVNEQLAAARAELGAFVRVDVSGNAPRVVYEKGALNVTAFQVNAQGQITSLAIAPAPEEITFGSLEEARTAFAALPGRTSLLVREVGGDTLVALNPSRPLAVGSAFKLAILAELQAQITRGERSWTDEMTLSDRDRSLPGGTLQDAPTGSRYTLRDLAARMIRDSDNTATDMLLNLVGRAGVEARLGQTAMPSTREAFVLKNPANFELLRAYRAAGLNREARREVLARAAAAPLPNVETFPPGPLATDVEWFVSTERLCPLIAEVAALPATTLNPGAADPADFARVSYKGGSEGGVLNLTTQVTTRSGRSYCVSATWNDARLLNENRFVSLYRGVLKLLR
ncbi:beta-lactamase class A [Deinobacterium chartae]|uniref:Beta-lactamase class A n=1 Tax=Deinobacterium chartae TaxID=521158 RepID=A0A841I6J9_9DEIO|nr:serine hydrolase [Deinobacterium chartae]MBB6099522.1 beta-lactamase class A [Deinobacterium chartae]